MPTGTKVESLYQKLRGNGKSKASAAKISQAVTRQSLQTGNFLRKVLGEK